MERYYTDPEYRKAILARNRARYHCCYKQSYKVNSTEHYNQDDENKKKYLEGLRLKFFLEYQDKKNEQLQQELELMEKKRKEREEIKKEYHRVYYLKHKLSLLEKMIETKDYPEKKKRGRKPKYEAVDYKIEIINQPKTISFT